MRTNVKVVDAAGRIGGYLIVWGDGEQRDLHGEYFTPETELGLDWYERRPVLYHHGLDDSVKASVIGAIDMLRTDDVGLWAEAQLDLRQHYVRAVMRLVETGAIHWSSGSLSHLVDVDEDGRILRWPLVEGSLTPTPAEPRFTDVQTIKSAYDALSLDASRLMPHTEKSKQTNGEHHMTAPLKTLPIARTDAAPRLTVTSEYDHLSAADLLHGYMIMRATKHFNGVSERYANALAHKVSHEQLSAVKADELSYTAQTGFGAEWVPELWSAQIWRRARDENVVLPLFRTIEMPSSPFMLPMEGTDPTVHYVQETSDRAQLTLGSSNTIPDSKMGSDNLTLTAKKLALRVGFSSELVEDSIVPVLTLYRDQAMRAIAAAIDSVLLNGDDDATSGNINTDSAPGGSESYLAFDGLRKAALTNHSVDMSNTAPTLAKMREARFSMGIRYAAKPSDLAWLVDGKTYAALLNLSEFLTMEKAGALTTAQTGQIGFIDGIPVFMSAEMPETDATGEVGASGNTQGTALCVYRPGWFVGYRRRVSVNVEYLTYYDAYQLTATVRLAFAPANDDVAAALINIQV